MKKLILGSTMAVAVSLSALAQGTVSLDNTANVNPSITATSSGLVWIGATVGTAVLLGSPSDPNLAASVAISGNTGEDDINFQVLGGSSAGSLSVIGTFLMSDMTAWTDNLFAQAGPGSYGLIDDPNALTYATPNTALGGTGTFEVLAWAGTYASYAAAVGHTYVGNSGVFTNPTGGSGTPASPPFDLVNMPALVLTPVPEPTTFAMMGLGLASVLAFRRRK